MKILVLAENYTTLDGVVSMHYIHSRNRYYISEGIDVSVVSFKAKNNYEIDGIKVYTINCYKEKLFLDKFDILLSHAPNLKNHLRFINKYGDNFPKLVFYFHGHEVLRTSQIYPKPYGFSKNKTIVKRLIEEAYDAFKLLVWKNRFVNFSHKSEFIFVSNWMYNMFIKYVKIDSEIVTEKKHIIYNCIGNKFEKANYCKETVKEYDFVTIRNNLDGSKYGIDIVTNIAKNNPQYKFCVVGKGEFYNYYEKPTNLEWINRNLNHDSVIEYLNKSKCALLPTRADAQGVMACEIATFGIPLITSDIDVCKEVFRGFKNVQFIHNEDKKIDIEPILKYLQTIKIQGKNEKYFAKNTVGKEIELFHVLKG